MIVPLLVLCTATWAPWQGVPEVIPSAQPPIHVGPLLSVKFISESVAISIGSDSSIRAWTLRDGGLRSRGFMLPRGEGTTGQLLAASVRSDGTFQGVLSSFEVGHQEVLSVAGVAKGNGLTLSSMPAQVNGPGGALIEQRTTSPVLCATSADGLGSVILSGPVENCQISFGDHAKAPSATYQLSGLGSGVLGCALSPDGGTAALIQWASSGSQKRDGVVTLISQSTGAQKQLRLDGQYPTAVSWGKAGLFVLTQDLRDNFSANSAAVHKVDPAVAKASVVFRRGAKPLALSLAVSPNGETFAIGREGVESGVCEVYDRNGVERSSYDGFFYGVKTVDVTDSGRVVMGSASGEVRIGVPGTQTAWEGASKLGRRITDLRWEGSDDVIVVEKANSTPCRFSLSRLGVLEQQSVLQPVPAVRPSPGAGFPALRNFDDGTPLEVFDWVGNDCLVASKLLIKPPGVLVLKPNKLEYDILGGFEQYVSHVRTSSSGRWIAVGSTDGAVRFYRTDRFVSKAPDGTVFLPDLCLYVYARNGDQSDVQWVLWNPESKRFVSQGNVDEWFGFVRQSKQTFSAEFRPLSEFPTLKSEDSIRSIIAGNGVPPDQSKGSSDKEVAAQGSLIPEGVIASIEVADDLPMSKTSPTTFETDARNVAIQVTYSEDVPWNKGTASEVAEIAKRAFSVSTAAKGAVALPSSTGRKVKLKVRGLHPGINRRQLLYRDPLNPTAEPSALELTFVCNAPQEGGGKASSGLSVFCLGVSEYDKFPGLAYVQKDVENLKDFYSGRCDQFESSSGTRDQILTSISKFAQEVRSRASKSKDDQPYDVVFYVSAHGVPVRPLNSLVSECLIATRECTATISVGAPMQWAPPLGGILWSEVFQKLTDEFDLLESGRVRVAFLVDTCFSGLATKSMVLAETISQIKRHSFAMMASSASNETSVGDTNGSLFTRAFLQVMKDPTRSTPEKRTLVAIHSEVATFKELLRAGKHVKYYEGPDGNDAAYMPLVGQ